MELKEVYQKVGGDYNAVMDRLLTEDRIKKYLLKFRDSASMDLITKPLEQEDYETAFREAHNLKGMCLNLGLDRLAKSSSDLTELLRGGKPDGDISAIVDTVTDDMNNTMQVLASL